MEVVRVILINDGLLRLGEQEQRIDKWEVWFHTPWGMCRSAGEAIEACKAAEIDPEVAIVPMPVAVGSSLYEVFFRG